MSFINFKHYSCTAERQWLQSNNLKMWKQIQHFLCIHTHDHDSLVYIGKYSHVIKSAPGVYHIVIWQILPILLDCWARETEFNTCINIS